MKRTAEGVFAPKAVAPLPYPAEVVIAALEPVVLPKRAARIERVIAARITSVAVVLDSLNDPHNVAAIMRTCDGFGVQEIHAIERDVELLLTARVTTGCEKWMALHRHGTAESCAAHLRAHGYALYVADMRATRSLDEIAAMPRVAVAFGREHEGISPALRAQADGAFAIPMRGMVESFNVSVAAGITLASVTRDRRGDLGASDAQALKARFLMESVREPEMVIERFVRDHGIAPPG
ncbi:MAG: RNA methyltransferase [Deltaproteobacteria bacterium]